MEGEYGVPTAPIVTARFSDYVIRDGQSHGMNLRWAFPPYPVGWVPRETLRGYVQGDDPVTKVKLMTELVDALTKPLTEEEKKVRNAQQELEAAATAEEQRLREWDESLLLRYSTVADIEAARERALRDLRIRLSILKGNKRSLKQQAENYQAQAADMERSGQKVDVARLGAIENIQKALVEISRPACMIIMRRVMRFLRCFSRSSICRSVSWICLRRPSF